MSLAYMEKPEDHIPALGLDIGVFAVKGILIDENQTKTVKKPISGKPAKATQECLEYLLQNYSGGNIHFGLVGQNSKLVAEQLGVAPGLEIEALQRGLAYRNISTYAVLSLGYENMHFLEFDEDGTVKFFNRNGQCAAGSGSFWYQQATRMGYDDKELAEVALEADYSVPISGRCAVFAKSDMTHAINEGATQSAVSIGMANALVDTIVTNVAQNRIKGPSQLLTVGGVANNKAVIKCLKEYAEARGVEVIIPEDHEYLIALGAALSGNKVSVTTLNQQLHFEQDFKPEQTLPPLDLSQIHYLDPQEQNKQESYDLSTVFIGVDCGSVSTKCALLDAKGNFLGGVYLPTTGRPALQVLELMKQVQQQYGDLVENSHMVACTTGSGRFLSQKILNAQYAVDEITCQAEGVRYLFGGVDNLSIIEIGGEDSKFLQIKDGILYDYNMNPVCAAGTGTFLENLAELLGVKIEEEFSRLAFQGEYAMDLGDTCTLLSQSALVTAAARGLPLESQLASLAYSSARNYLSKTVENRPLEGKVIFTGATAKNQALASAFAAETNTDIYIPSYPELTGALGSALVAKNFYQQGEKEAYSFRSLNDLNYFELEKKACNANCQHEHNCTLNVISFKDGNKFIYGDRCGRYSDWKKDEKADEYEDYASRRQELLYESVSIFKEATPETTPKVGLARCGLYYEYYPFWAAFFQEIGAQVVVSSRTSQQTLEKGKRWLDSDMCYPMKVLVGHYYELLEKDLDYIFVPEVVNAEPLPWADNWPRSFTCPLMQTIRGTVKNSLQIKDEKMLYAQLNYRGGKEQIVRQLKPVAQKLLGGNFKEKTLERAIESGYQAMETYEEKMQNESVRIMEYLTNNPREVVAVFLSRPYTIYDEFVAKGSLKYARQKGIIALPHDFLISYLKGWYRGRISSPFLDPLREEFEEFLHHILQKMDHIYPIQLQKMLTTAILVRFLNERSSRTGLPFLNLVLQDPFKCGPNAMLRHYLDSITGYLRLTLDEHTAAAGMITRLEAFKNTILSRNGYQPPDILSAQTSSAAEDEWDKILIPDAAPHAHVFAALFKSFGKEAEVLPPSQDKDLTLAKKYVNGEECLPFIQNLQDYLEYLQRHHAKDQNKRIVFFQGWACGPCRYGLYAPTQSLAIHRAGYGKNRICSVKYDDIIKKFGLGIGLGAFAGIQSMDMLYKMLHSTRPYEKREGAAEELFYYYANQLLQLLENFQFKLFQLPRGNYLRPLEALLQRATEDFSRLPLKDELRPVILVGGEFYVRLDERCNQGLIKRIEGAGGEACLAPASELFSYTLFIQFQEASQALEVKKNFSNYINKLAYSFINRLAHRDEHRISQAVSPLLENREEPDPQDIMENAVKYVSRHYGGEPPMTIGRTAAFANRERVTGAVFVAPFTCMPGSVVEAQARILQEDIELPIVSVYYDGKDNANRDELIDGLVFQAKQRLDATRKQVAF